MLSEHSETSALMNDAEKRYLILLRMTGRFFLSFFTFLRETVISCMSINSLYIHFLKTVNLANKTAF